jgi:DNA-binding response OmpR family regulator
VSSGTGGVDRVRGALAGCDAFLTKPIDDVVLRRLLAAHGTSVSRPGPMRALQR